MCITSRFLFIKKKILFLRSKDYFVKTYQIQFYGIYLNILFLLWIYFCSLDFRAAIDRSKRFPKNNVTSPNGINKRNVSNIFNCNQKTPNKARMLPKPKWKPSALKLIGKLETFTPNLAHKMSKMKSGAAHRAVKTSDTMRGGRFSGWRNWWIISGLGACKLPVLFPVRAETCARKASINYKSCEYFIW